MGDKCSFTRRSYYPGQHGQRRTKFTEYGIQLREKQKARRIYGVLEKQFRRFFDMADKTKGVTGENLLILLERRLDNVIYRMGLARSRNESRQLVRHRHFKVNGRRVNVPSYLVKEGDVIEVVERSRKTDAIVVSLDAASKRGFPNWIEMTPTEFKGKISAYPVREDIPMDLNEQLIVELYSK